MTKPNQKIPLEKRCRSVPFPRPFIRATIAGAFFFLTLIAFTTSLVGFAIVQTQTTASLVIASLFLLVISWIFSIVIRRTAHCPLCKGTPYFDSGAHKHEKATKLPLVSYAISNLLTSVLFQTFRCMFCGQAFDLLKPVSNPIGQQKGQSKLAKIEQARRKKSVSKKRRTPSPSS